jgi:predicted phosphodiesterase
MPTKADLAREYRAKFKKTPTLTLAKKMYNDNAEVFKDVEAARTALRYIEGKVGNGKKVGKVTDSEFFKQEARPLNPFSLPDSDESKFEPYIIKGHKRVGMLSDIHLPYHSIEALTTSIKFLKDEKVDALILNGDTRDFYQASRFQKDPRKRSIAHELESNRKLYDVLQKELDCQIYDKWGNHCERYEQYLMVKAPELLGIEEFELENLLKCKERGIKMVKDKRVIHLNKLNIIHGHEFGQSVFSPVNIARGLFLRGKVSAIQGHNHSTSEHTEPNLNGEITTTWSLGCLCELHPAYLPINKWNHGFAIVDVDANGKDFFVRNKRIYKGKVL